MPVRTVTKLRVSFVILCSNAGDCGWGIRLYTRRAGTGTQQFPQYCGCATQFFIAGQAIGAESEPLPARVAQDGLTLQPGWKLHRVCQADGKKCSMVLIATLHRVDTRIGEVSTQGVQLREAVRAEPLNAHRQGEFQTTPCLVPRKHGRRGLEKTIATCVQHRQFRTLVSKGVGVGKPADVQRAQAGLEPRGAMYRKHAPGPPRRYL